MRLISEKYAEALYSAAASLGCMDAVSSDFTWIKPLAEQQSMYFRSPLVSGAEKENLIRELLTSNANQITMEFLLMLSSRGHWRHLPDAIDRFQLLSDGYYRRISLDLHVPFKLEQETLDRLQLRFRREGLIPADADEVALHIIEDKSIVGGFIAVCNGHQIDASLRTQLARIRHAER